MAYIIHKAATRHEANQLYNAGVLLLFVIGLIAYFTIFLPFLLVSIDTVVRFFSGI